MSRNKYPWKWNGGVHSIHGTLTPFVIKILENPSDSLTRLVLADYLEDTFEEAAKAMADSLRQRGHWKITGYSNVPYIGISWELDDWRSEVPTYTLSHIRRSLIPPCHDCKMYPDPILYNGNFIRTYSHYWHGEWVCCGQRRLLCESLVRTMA
jgi:hypothetical protein